MGLQEDMVRTLNGALAQALADTATAERERERVAGSNQLLASTVKSLQQELASTCPKQGGVEKNGIGLYPAVGRNGCLS